VSLNGHAAKLVIKHLEREGWGFKQIRSSSKEMEKGAKKKKQYWIRMRIMWSPSNLHEVFQLNTNYYA
jgi:hypothetical protein